ncbi:DZIP1L [Symbiodinium necroappetens]|uniref:DZIP1L protein n=1 Tax=Symbiodinium necroappetens TaxID=1628268 RepID=A0A812RC35_9DINO|nr:DZIP1L [Symbiodinium necroappetens]
MLTARFSTRREALRRKQGFLVLHCTASAWSNIPKSHPLTSGVGLLRTVLPAADELLKDAEGAYPNLGHKFTSFPKFIFRPRTGRINWRLLHSLDLDRVVREGDIDTIQAYLDNITYSRFSREDLEVTSDDGLIKVVQLAQLCMEYLNSMCASSQQLIQGLSERVRIQAAQLKASDAGRRRSRPRRNSPRESRGPPVGAVARKCTYCSKRFQSEQYLNEHLMRRHMADAFPIRVEKAPSPPHEFAEPSPIRSAGTFFPPKQCGSLRGKTRFSHWAREVPAAGACLRGSCFGCCARLRRISRSSTGKKDLM